MDLDYELTAKTDSMAPQTKRLTKYDTRKQPTLNFQLEKTKPA